MSEIYSIYDIDYLNAKDLFWKCTRPKVKWTEVELVQSSEELFRVRRRGVVEMSGV